MKSHTTTLENGLRIITVPMEDNPTATVLAIVEAGTKYEYKDHNGISHFLEHMCFKGTEKRPTALDISGELDGLGAESNAFTWYEYTGYYAKARTENVADIFDVVADVYLNSTLPAPEMEKEKGVIIEEINMYNDLPMRLVHDDFRALVYGDQPAGWPVLGPAENIRNMTREDFVRYRERLYVPEATTIVVAGGIDPEKINALGKEAFADVPAGSASEMVAVKEAQANPEVTVRERESDQSHLVLGFRAHDVYDDRLPATEVLSAVLGRGMSSRLFQRLREQMGVCYYVKSSCEYYTDSGLFKLFAGVDTSRSTEVVEVLCEEAGKLVDKKVPEQELSKAKEYLAGNFLLNHESSDELASYYGERSTLHEELKTPAEYVEELKAVTAGDVQSVAQDLFKNNRLNLAVVGPADSEELINVLDIVH